jgi:hypothetical protein
MKYTKIFGTIILLFIVLLFFACTQKSKITYKDLEGGWWWVNSDSTYAESFFRNDSLWDCTKRTNIALSKIELENDSLQIFRSNGDKLGTMHIRLVNKNQIVFTSKHRQVVCTRLTLRINPNHHFSSYDPSSHLYTFINRGYDWYNRTHN